MRLFVEREPWKRKPVPDFDPRVTLLKDGVADLALEGLIPAERYLRPRTRQCAITAAPIRRDAANDAEQTNQLVTGELFDVLDETDGWAFGRARRDGYVGWAPAAALAEEPLTPTHRVSAVRTYAFPAPDVKASPARLVTLNALVTAEAREGRFLRCARLGWIVESQLASLDTFERDAVAVAERHLGAPYQWGGRESLGLDCSGLLQQSLFACGRACPRDADMQERETGEAIEPGADYADLRRGDLVFWNGHVAMMVDPANVIHATSHHMAVAVEPLVDVVARMQASGSGEPTSFRRL